MESGPVAFIAGFVNVSLAQSQSPVQMSPLQPAPGCPQKLVNTMPIRMSQVDRNFLDSCTVIPMHQTMPKGKPVTTG